MQDQCNEHTVNILWEKPVTHPICSFIPVIPLCALALPARSSKGVGGARGDNPARPRFTHNMSTRLFPVKAALSVGALVPRFPPPCILGGVMDRLSALVQRGRPLTFRWRRCWSFLALLGRLDMPIVPAHGSSPDPLLKEGLVWLVGEAEVERALGERESSPLIHVRGDWRASAISSNCG